MASPHLKTFVHSLFADRKRLHSFIQAPEEVLAHQPISRDEHNALLRLGARLGRAEAGLPVNQLDSISWP